MRLGPEQGVTLVELMVVVAVAAILAMIAIPSFNDTLERRRLEGAANELSADLQYARSQAVADNVTVTLTTTASGYTITGNQTYKTVAVSSGLALTNAVTVNFLPLRGCTNATCTASDASITVSSSRITPTLRLTTTNMGRVYMCSPSGTFSGYASC